MDTYRSGTDTCLVSTAIEIADGVCPDRDRVCASFCDEVTDHWLGRQAATDDGEAVSTRTSFDEGEPTVERTGTMQ